MKFPIVGTPDSPGGSGFESSSCPSAHINYEQSMLSSSANRLTAQSIEQQAQQAEDAMATERSNRTARLPSRSRRQRQPAPSLMPLNLQSMASNTGALNHRGPCRHHRSHWIDYKPSHPACVAMAALLSPSMANAAALPAATKPSASASGEHVARRQQGAAGLILSGAIPMATPTSVYWNCPASFGCDGGTGSETTTLASS